MVYFPFVELISENISPFTSQKHHYQKQSLLCSNAHSATVSETFCNIGVTKSDAVTQRYNAPPCLQVIRTLL